jgi:hypothetical protein
MPEPRRRIVRPTPTPLPVSRRLTKLRSRLENEQRLLTGWMVRLKRSFNAFDKYQRRVIRLEREIRQLEQPNVAHN